MKSIKDLKIKTKEGLEVKNLQRFPSMEWGPEGGLQADLYVNGEYVGQVYQAGDGGCASYTYPGVEASRKLAEAGIAFLKRVDKNYGPDTPYDWLKDKSAKTFQDDDIEAIVGNIEERYENVKTAKKAFKEGYKAIAILQNDYEKRTLAYKVADITVKEVREYMCKQKLDKKYPEVEIITCNDNLSVL